MTGIKSWTEVPLGEVLELKRGYDPPERDRMPGSVPVVTSAGVTGSHSEAKVKGPGVVTGRYGTIGEVYFIREDFWPHNTALYVRDFKGNDPRYAAYLLRTVNYLAHVDKAAVPGVNRNHLHYFRVRVAPLIERHAIARILGALDDKIELNRRTNETLEAAARALFKSWFVDFDPVRAKAEGRRPAGMDADTAAIFPSAFGETDIGEVPTGWRVGSVLDQAELMSGGTPRTEVAEYWGGSIPWASAKDVSRCGDCFLVATERTITDRGLSESATQLIPATSYADKR